jgi:metallophosphoesterase superfamily enzyme
MMHSSLSRALERHQEHALKHHPPSVDLITTKQKQNKLPSFIDIDIVLVLPTSSAYHMGTRMRLIFIHSFRTSLVGSFDTRASFSVYTPVPAWYLPNTKS